MTTTTYRLPDELKATIDRLAADAGMTAHGYVVDALRRQTEQDLARSEFHAEARDRLDEMDRTGMAVPWQDVRQYLIDRAAGKAARWPKARKTQD
jgi:predicted transcriptional regulator